MRCNTLRRGVLIALGALLSRPACVFAETLASLHSVRSDTPCAMTVLNQRDSVLKVFWLNYDGKTRLRSIAGSEQCAPSLVPMKACAGEMELFSVLPPGASYTIDTFEV